MKIRNRKILIMGLPGSGKTTLAKALTPLLGAVHFNADDVRANINADLGFSIKDRLEQARRMGWLCDRVTDSGNTAIADFICPTAATRAAFGQATIIWVDRIESSRFEDTNRLFEPPESYDFRVTAAGSAEHWAEKIYQALRPTFDFKQPTALFVGRYQPFHDGHKALIATGIDRVGQACIAIRDTHGTDEKNPFDYAYVKARIEETMKPWAGRFTVLPLPNITNIFYGRDVGYTIERIDLSDELHGISATDVRRRIAS